ncbi:MAG: hypothetical protein LWX83_13440 [Anaerolineae bacterium]|nr:hypothetical protein [Anaerolineae bacterium]
MPDPRYLIPRLIRHFMPDKAVRVLLLRSIIIRPGLETSDPTRAVEVYTQTLTEAGRSLQGKRVLLFGYGGRYAVGCALLRAGAAQVVLCEKAAPPDHVFNRSLLPENADYLYEENGQVFPRAGLLTLMQGDIREMAGSINPVDVVLSTSVYEHLDDVDGITAALAALTAPDGVQLHFVDLRDHFFKYPFEMLCYERDTWLNWLNPTSHHNRFRLWNYRQVFERYFKQVDIKINQSNAAAFNRERRRIRPEFISGDETQDTATLIQVLASGPFVLAAKE